MDSGAGGCIVASLRLAAALAIWAAAPSFGHAAPVYRCVGPGGTVAYRDVACDDAGGVRLELETAAPGEAPPAVRELVARYEARREARPAAGKTARRRAAERPHFRCTTSDGIVSYRTSACPKPRAVKGKPAITMREEQVSAREACEGRHLLLDPYERDKRGPPECGPRR